MSNTVAMHLANAIQSVFMREENPQVQRKIYESEKMAALGSLVAGVSHEINTPIGVSLTASSDLEERIRTLASHHQAKTLTFKLLDSSLELLGKESCLIRDNLLRAGDLIHSFKRIAVDQSHEVCQWFNLHDYLQDIVKSMHSVLKKGGHRCEIACARDLMLYGSPGSFAQIITNLINNALIHGFEGKRNGVITVTCSRDDSLAIVEVKDDGMGVPPENLDWIFDPFFTTKLGQGGSGLGLNIVYSQIVSAWHGSISAHCESGSGLLLRITLPLPEPQPQPQPQPQAQPSGGSA